MSRQSNENPLLKIVRPAIPQNAAAQQLPSPPPAYNPYSELSQMALQTQEDGFDSDADSQQSPIVLNIICPISVNGHGNMIAIEQTHMAINIAQSIINGIKEASMSKAGIPMIDEDGRPRPIQVRVDAGVKVQGTRNTIGERAVLCAMKSALDLKRDREQAGEDADRKTRMEDSQAEELERVQKRQRDL